ncbi:DUF6418 domain-containing protein [Burkholderia vietnamiensis]|uniref:DUF6418 domain-containing protein n=1 Tax=Burkholderia vietnamiensis TaxID=60552 RepID=UPI000F80E454|nr:DUF6418 domain-containing protein [Burkholderia vietnamiensis]HDR9127920.1 hypothetical protein [Burkholderia vietnamiensis]
MNRNIIVLAGIVVALSILLFLLSYADLGSVLAPLTIAVYVLLVVVFLRTSGRAALLLVPFAVLKLSELVSVVMIEFGATMSEIGLLGHDIGASSGLLLHDVAFFMGAIWILRARRAGTAADRIVLTRLSARLAFAIGGAICLIGVVAGLAYGFSLFSGMDRFSFRASAGNAPLSFFLANRLIAVFLFGILAAGTRRSGRRLASIGVVLVMVINMLHGEQLMSTVSLIVSFFGVRTIAEGDERDFVRKLARVGLIAAVFGLGAVALSYASQKKDVFVSVAARAVLQGQLWYAVAAEQAGRDEVKPESIGRNIGSLSAPSVDDYVNLWPPVGVRELMYKFADTSLYNAYTENGVTFTMGTSGYLYYLFGFWPSLLAECLLGMFAAVMARTLVSAMSGANLLLLVVSAKLYALLMLGLQQGDFWYLFGVRTIFTVLIFWIAIAVFSKRRYRPSTMASRIG